MIDIAFFLIFAAALFVIGMYGLLTSKKGLVTLMCIELMLNAYKTKGTTEVDKLTSMRW